MALNFGDHDDVVFTDAPLVSVVCQIRFPPILSLMSIAGLAGFQEAIINHYPTLLPGEQNTTIEVAAMVVGINSSAPVWRFQDESKTWTVSLAVDFLALETSAYSDIDEFLAKMNTLLSALRQTLRPADSVRVGLRKVNSIQNGSNQTTDFAGKIRPELLGPLVIPEFPASISQYFSLLNFRDGDSELAVRSGLYRETVEDPTGFMLDLDYYTERPYRIEGGENLTELLRYFSDGMTSFFHWALEDGFKQSLRPTTRTSGEM